jgi:hypothetical protein
VNLLSVRYYAAPVGSACMTILRSVKYYAAPPTLRLHKGLGSYAKNAASLTPERV